MPINLAPYLPEPFDQRRVPAAFDSLISTIMQGRKMTQEQGQFDVEQERLRAGDAADAQYKQGLLSNEKARLGQADKHHKDTAAAKRREDQTKAAELIGKALDEGNEGVIVSMAPYLQALGMSAKVQESDPVMQPMAAFADGIPQMDFQLGPRKLVFTADGMPMGDIDLDQLQQMQRAPSEKMLQALVAGASDTDRPAMHQMVDAASANPRMMAQDPDKLFDSVTGAAAQVTGQERADQRSLQNRLQAEALADASRANQVKRETLSQSKEERLRLATARSFATSSVNQAMKTFDVPGNAKQEQSAKKALSFIDGALNSGATIQAGTLGRTAVTAAVTTFNGKNASNMEYRNMIETNAQAKYDNAIKYWTSGGELNKEQLEALRKVVGIMYEQARGIRMQAAKTARQNVWEDTYLQALAPDLIEKAGHQAGAQILGFAGEGNNVSAPPGPEAFRTPGIPGSAIENQADELRAQDPAVDAEYNRLLGGDDARP